MVDLLGLRLEDSSEANFTSATKLKALNVAQTTVVNYLNESYLTELQVQSSLILNSGQVASGAIELGSSITPIRNRFVAVEVKYAGDFKFAIMIPFEDVKAIENQYLSPSQDSPVSWIFNNKLHIRPNDGMTNLKLYYLGLPTDITASSTASDLNVSLHETVLDFAEAQLWRMDNQVERANIAQNMAMNTIKILNDRYSIEAPVGVGTKSPRSN